MKSVHKTSTSYKPNLSKKPESKCQLDIVNLNIKEVSPKPYKEEKPSTPKCDAVYEERMSLMKKAYESKITELQH